MIAAAQNVANDVNNADWTELIPLLADHNTPKYNSSKLCEELAELLEVLLKFENKIPEKKPSSEAIIDELGDVILRVAIYAHQEGWLDEVDNRLIDKAKKLLGYALKGEYVGGI